LNLRKICAQKPGLQVYFEGRRTDLDGLIRRVRVAQRSDLVPEAYTLILESAL